MKYQPFLDVYFLRGHGLNGFARIKKTFSYTQYSNIPLFHHSIWLTNEKWQKKQYNSNKLQEFRFIKLSVESVFIRVLIS